MNTSGSGKTRLLLEGLIRYWGFYFTATPGFGSNELLGSVDVYNTINTEIPGTEGFVSNPSSRSTERDRRGAFESNHLIAKRRIHQNLIARIIIFEWFLKTAREKLPNASVDSLRERWLYLQLRPTTFFGEDVFSALSKILTDASNNYLGMGAREINGYLSQVLERYQLGRRFYLVLDEAQYTHGKAGLDRCFRSESNMSTLRPVLRPILKSWIEAVEFPVILSGTGISMAVVSDVIASLKSTGFNVVKSIGAFDNQELQKRYMLRYMPPKYAESESGAFLIERAWNFIRGRYCFCLCQSCTALTDHTDIASLLGS